MPGLDRGEEPAAVLEPAEVDLARPRLRSRCPAHRESATGEPCSSGHGSGRHSLVVGRQDLGSPVAIGVDDLDGMHDETLRQ